MRQKAEAMHHVAPPVARHQTRSRHDSMLRPAPPAKNLSSCPGNGLNRSKFEPEDMEPIRGIRIMAAVS